jgi:hypothetical protein
VTALSAADRTRLARLLGMLGSDHACELANDGAMSDRLVRGRETTWASVLSAAAEKSRPDPRTYDRGFEAGYAQARRDLLPPWRAMREWCLDGLDLAEREHDFLVRLVRWKRLSAKQIAWLEAIFSRCPVRQPAT